MWSTREVREQRRRPAPALAFWRSVDTRGWPSPRGGRFRRALRAFRCSPRDRAASSSARGRRRTRAPRPAPAAQVAQDAEREPRRPGSSGASGFAHADTPRSAQDVRVRVHLARRRGDQHDVTALEVVPAGECLAEGGLREGNHAPGCPSRMAAAVYSIANAPSKGKGAGQRSGWRPSGACLALNLRAREHRRPLRCAAKRCEGLRAGQFAGLYRLPLERPRQGLQDALRREVRDGACEIEVEGALHRLQRA